MSGGSTDAFSLADDRAAGQSAPIDASGLRYTWPVNSRLQRLTLIAACLLGQACSTFTVPAPSNRLPSGPGEEAQAGAAPAADDAMAVPLAPLSMSDEHPGADDPMIVQPAAVLERFFPDPSARIDTPAFTRQDGFTTYDELTGFVDELHRRCPQLVVFNLAYSQQGRRIPMLVFSTTRSGTALAIRASGKPTVWIHAQLHGNEPASGEAALAIAADLAGPLSMLLDRINVVIIPRVNVDGSTRLTRDAADGRDLNRDALRLDIPESLALRRASLAYQPAVTVDAHEYYATRSSLARLGMGNYLEAHDLLVQGPANPNVPRLIRSLSNDLFIAQIQRRVSAAGLSAHPYYTVQIREAEESGQADRIELWSGGAEPRIGRNFHGLLNQASILLESRGIGIGRQSFRRRVFTLLTAMRSVLHTTWEHASRVQQDVAAAGAEVIARGAIIGDRDDLILKAARSTIPDYRLPFINVDRATLDTFQTTWRGFDPPEPLIVRERPYAYILTPQAGAAAVRLAAFGVDMIELKAPQAVEVQAWRVNAVTHDDRPYEQVIRQHAQVSIETHRQWLPAGSKIIYMAQPLGNLIAECLEPEASDSFVRFGVLPARAGDKLPVYRYMHPVGIPIS